MNKINVALIFGGKSGEHEVSLLSTASIYKHIDKDKYNAWEKYHFDVMFVGDDWKGTDKWNKIEADLNVVGAKVVYFPYTKGTSSTLINETLHKLRGE